MSIFLKIMVILNFLIAIVAAVGAWLIFDQRDIFKARIQVHEKNWNNVATQLEWGQFVGSEFRKDDPQKWGAWPTESDSDSSDLMANIKNPIKMEQKMRELASAAADRTQMMKTNRQGWDLMIGNMTTTNATLASTRQTLSNTEDDLEEMTKNRDDLSVDVENKTQAISKLETEKQGLQADINAREAEVSKLNGQKTELEEKLVQSEDELLTKTEELRRCELGYIGIVTVEEGGKIIYIQPEYNFVIINLGRKNKVQLGSEAMVHRGEELIAKINITSVEEDVSVGTVASEWQLKEIKSSDEVIFL